MERSEWLKKIRQHTEDIYDHFSVLYGPRWGNKIDPTHIQFMDKFLARLAPRSRVLDVACGAGLYDELLCNAGHTVLGIDQSAGVLDRARATHPAEKFPNLRYEKVGFQEMAFQAEFDGLICMDSLEHLFPEKWPAVVRKFAQALKPGGALYFTVEEPEGDEAEVGYKRALAMGLPVVPGELVDQAEENYERLMAMDPFEISDELAGVAVYHYYPGREKVRAWLAENGLVVHEEGVGKWYAHFLASKSS